ncbi:MmgE/PrpD family protein [Rhodococcus sp. HM1]|uniref:MmgE/PrpD family protein n=1 Tax=unclassified Rhodococcus (in: high G+C Gram-positive bacteria) TaxID=192944 RepID=UPI0018CDBCA3|nr:MULTISPECIES: MmgE/PrpD family protein [unclassified Rhodococcus (in: high G+C Gram-positive bacteria)]MBH0122201.1 MmgE/PrpD family protein [Rhodococcus sp. CX]MCK8669945.1 MmgE/PrpD family protein [Rhodococcus sp. HM1]
MSIDTATRTTPEPLEEQPASPEQLMARFVADTVVADIPSDVLAVAHQVLRTVCGTAIAGAGQDGIAELRKMVVVQGGRGEARSLVHGDPLPAQSAALLNGTMARALDYCDTMVPGLHLGSSVVPAALAAAELRGGCTGSEFLAALAVGLEAGIRFNLTEEQYAGLDPTGVAGLLGATAAAARAAGLDAEQTLNALALSFNRCAASFQSNVDASLAVRLIQGWTAASAVQSVQFAQAGLTGPANYISGPFGYARLYARGERTPESFVEEIGSRYGLGDIFFKKYPSCGLTQGVTESALLALESVGKKNIERVDIHLPEFAHNLIGKPFEPGTNPRVNAQFSAQYTCANALERGASLLEHFEPERVAELDGSDMLARIRVHFDPELTGHSSSRVEVHTTTGGTWVRTLEVGPGYPGNPLTPEEQAQGFGDCVGYAPWGLPADQVRDLEWMTSDLTTVEDVRSVVTALISPDATPLPESP